jgi:hypothetical protein
MNRHLGFTRHFSRHEVAPLEEGRNVICTTLPGFASIAFGVICSLLSEFASFIVFKTINDGEAK